MATLEVSLNQATDKEAPTDPELWMTDLPPQLRKMPLIQLAIPGSHDSMTYAITSRSKLAPDAEPILRNLRFLGPILTAFMTKWCKTQTTNATDQLRAGIRYFDLRIATKAKSDQFYFVHGLYADEVFQVLQGIRSFLDERPNEVVILDCQHFYAFQRNHHQLFMSLLTTFFGRKLLPYTLHLDTVSLHRMAQKGHQVILIYRSDAARFAQPYLWPSPCFPTPWADTVSVPTLISFLVEKLKLRDANCGFVSQCVLTPSTGFVVTHFFRTLKTTCFLTLQNAKYEWLKGQRPGWRGLNVVISDFVGYDDGAFAKVVIDLNRKLLEEGNGDKMTPIDDGH